METGSERERLCSNGEAKRGMGFRERKGEKEF